ARLHDVPVLVAEEWTVVSGYAECAQALRDPRLRVEDTEWLDLVSPGWRRSQPVEGALQTTMLASNPPRHQRLRRLVSRVFTPRRVADLRGSVQRLAGQLTDRLADSLATAAEPVDFMAEFAYPLPVSVIGTMLGLPETDWPWFRQDAADYAF